MKYYSSELDILNALYSSLSLAAVWGKSKKGQKRAEEFIKSGEDFYTSDDKKVLCDENISLTEKIKYLEEKHNEFEKLKKQNDEENAKNSAGLCKDFIVAFEFMKKRYDEYSFIKDGENITVAYIDNDAFRKTLILNNASCENDKINFQSINWYELSVSDGKYCLEIAFSDDEELYFCSFTFESVSTKTENFNGMNSPWLDGPWSYLTYVAENIVNKSEYANEAMNDSERELLPLATALMEIPGFPETAKCIDCSDEILENFARLAQTLLIPDITTERIKKGKITTATLNDVKYEVLWNFIYEKFSSSQKDYPSKAELFCDKKELSDMRKKIVRIIKESGFEGEYPYFYKSGSFTKPVTFTSYGMHYTLFSEKDITHHIRCIETFSDRCEITFICGFVSNKTKRVYKNDAFAATFSARGKRYYQTLEFASDNGDFSGGEDTDIEEFASVAVKKATLMKLTKDESKNYHFMGNVMTGKKLMFVFVFSSLWFGVLCPLAMMAFVLAMLMFETGSLSIASEEVLKLPWVAMGAASGLLFGALMTIAMAIISKKGR